MNDRSATQYAAESHQRTDAAPHVVRFRRAVFSRASRCCSAMAYGGWKWWQVRQFELEQRRGDPANAIGPPLTEFELTERSGKPFRSADMNGTSLGRHAISSRPAPASASGSTRTSRVMHNMPELKDVTWVSITCDPDTDTLEALRDYADRLQADPERWLFCRGRSGLHASASPRGMNVFLSRKGHQDYAVVIDKAGKIRGMFDATSTSRVRANAQTAAEVPGRKAAARSGRQPARAKEKSS